MARQPDPLAREPVPVGYAVRLALSHHLGGWKPCAGPPKCEQCVRNNAPSTTARKMSRREVSQAAQAPAGAAPATAEGKGGPPGWVREGPNLPEILIVALAPATLRPRPLLDTRRLPMPPRRRSGRPASGIADQAENENQLSSQSSVAPYWVKRIRPPVRRRPARRSCASHRRSGSTRKPRARP